MFVCQDRANELALQGHEVHVITTSATSSAGEVVAGAEAAESGVIVHYLGAPAQEWSRAFAELAATRVENVAPEILHLDSFDRENVWWPGMAPRVAVTMHGLGWGGWLTEWNKARAYGETLAIFPARKLLQEAEGLAQADIVFGVSRWEHRLLRDQYGIERARLLYNPIAPYFFEERPRRERHGFLCVAVSQGGTRGFKIAEAAARRAGVRLTVATDIRRDGMVELYDRAQAIVLPTAFCQGYDLSVAEARARGCPAIMSPTGSYLDEALPEWDELVGLGNVAELAHVMKTWGDVRRLRTVEAETDPRHKPAEHVRRWLELIQGVTPRTKVVKVAPSKRQSARRR